MKFNLLGQRGTQGETNPDAPEAGPYIYDTPPGRGDNKGLLKTSFGSIGVADEKTHNKKLKEEGLEPIPSGIDLSSTSFAPKEEVEEPKVKVSKKKAQPTPDVELASLLDEFDD